MAKRWLDPRQLALPFRRFRQPKVRGASDLRKLEREWDRKLKDDGFVDIEWRHTTGPDYIQRPRARIDEATGAYYRLAEQFAAQLEDEHERELWALHAQGKSRTRIKRSLGMERDREARTLFEHLRVRFRWWMQRQLGAEPSDEPETIEDEIALTFARLSGGA